jgi:hypothetical protein
MIHEQYVSSSHILVGVAYVFVIQSDPTHSFLSKDHFVGFLFVGS